MTPKQFVLSKYPKAKSKEYHRPYDKGNEYDPHTWCIDLNDNTYKYGFTTHIGFDTREHDYNNYIKGKGYKLIHKASAKQAWKNAKEVIERLEAEKHDIDRFNFN